jgi:uncharacterized protein YjbI with pentapeptide repeats
MANEEHVKILMQGVDAWNQWRMENPDVRPDLYRTDFRTPELRGVPTVVTKYATEEDIREFNLIMGQVLDGINFSNVNLREANLSFAFLNRADFSGANLAYADLTNTRLFFSNFHKANLIGVDFSGAMLNDAHFSEAVVGETSFGKNDLSTVTGLDSVYHAQHSFIGTETIKLSKGGLARAFLLECGVSKQLIEYIDSAVESEQAGVFYSCFISYSHADKSFARRLYARLIAQGIRCWLDEHQVLPGQKIYTEVDRGIRLWDKVLLCCSKDSLRSWWVENEIQIAFEKEQQLRRQREGEEVLALIPLNLDGYLFGGEWKSGLRTEIRSRLAADFTGWETDNSKFEAAFEKLVRALRADAGGRELPPRPRL